MSYHSKLPLSSNCYFQALEESNQREKSLQHDIQSLYRQLQDLRVAMEYIPSAAQFLQPGQDSLALGSISVSSLPVPDLACSIDFEAAYWVFQEHKICPLRQPARCQAK